jgi:hypothetical protein
MYRIHWKINETKEGCGQKAIPYSCAKSWVEFLTDKYKGSMEHWMVKEK